ncbi:tail fiber assembly protein [Enterobacter sp. R4-368]|uniref:tail fiber assembly protein n=1 Tax=Enterobacter sp. R4-368 TaxID=1166130 RepID=UPI00034EFF37|nr:tail fiber assembly protein [Enterobacter sp. R4-368]AGN85275.1 hypothetical protein H650_08875 [Enterobacter sp. R4-368]
MYLFSKETLAFYPGEHIDVYKTAGTLPDDVIEVDNETRDKFNFAPPTGKKLGADQQGRPTWREKTAEEQVESALFQKQSLIVQANEFINNKQWPGRVILGRLKDDELTQYGRWLDYINALEAIDTATAPDIPWPEKPQ